MTVVRRVAIVAAICGALILEPSWRGTPRVDAQTHGRSLGLARTGASRSGTGPIRTLHLNMQGLVGGTNQANRDEGINYVSWLMKAGRPVAVSLNEVCPRQVREIASRFGDTYAFTYAPSYSGSHSGSSGCNDRGREPEYGNAIFLRYRFVSRRIHQYSETDSSSTRNIVCLKTAVYLVTYRACSTHLSVPPPLAQRNELRFAMLSSKQSSTASFAMGYLNTSRASLLSIYMDSFKEADRSH